MALESGKIFATAKNLNHDYSQGHYGEKNNRLAIVFEKLFQTVKCGGE
jgi:hypothetical protein